MSFVNTVELVGDDVLAASIIERSVAEIADNIAISIGGYAFSDCTALTEVNFHAAKSVGVYAFQSCTALTEANLTAVESIGAAAFSNCKALTEANLPAVESIDASAFQSCTALTALIIRSETVCKLSSINAFSSTPIANGTGYIYVLRALVDSYKAATNWSTFAAQFRALEDYTVDGTTTGELDPAKIAA